MTRLDTGGRDWIEQPRPPLVRGVGIIDTDGNPKETGCDTQNTELVDHDWHEVRRKHRYKKSIRNRDYGQIVSEMDNFEAPRTYRTIKTDGCTSPVTDIFDRCPSECMSEEDGYDSDIAVLSDFSDDSSIFGIRKVLRHRVPYRGRKPQFKHGFAPAPRTPPVKAKTHADRWQHEKNSTRAQYTRWLYGTPLDHKEADFVGYVRYFTNICLKVNHDPRLDRYYPRLVRSLARAARVVRTLPHCRGNHRRRRDLMMRLFDDDMEQSDVVRDRFPD